MSYEGRDHHEICCLADTQPQTHESINNEDQAL